MAITNQKSTQETNRTANPPVKNPAYNSGGRERVAYFGFTQSGIGDIGSTVDLINLPPGKVRLLKTDSKFVCSAFGALRTLSIGHLAYTKPDGSAVAAVTDNILTAGDVSAAAAIACGAGANALGDDPTILFESKDGVTLQASVAGGTIPDLATLKGFFTFVVD